MQTPTPRPLVPGDRLECQSVFSGTHYVKIVVKADAKFAYLENGINVSQTPLDAQKGIYSQYWTRQEHRENRYSMPTKYRLLTPEYEAEKAAALAAKIEQIKAILDKGITETQAVQMLKILNPAPAK